MNDVYSFIRLTAHDRDWRAAYQAMSADNFAALAPANRWGAFYGLFGVASNELIVVAVGDTNAVDIATEKVASIDAVADVESLLLVPTVRPTTPEPLTREGLYVFRFFSIDNSDIDEIARVSQQAWKTFENTDDYESEPQALFCQHDRSQKEGQMLLLTWYDGLNSWQTSREPAPEAKANFARRRQMTHSMIAYATRIIL